MHVILSFLLVLLGVAGVPSPDDQAFPVEPAPLVAVACGDCLDFFLLLEDPAVQTRILEIADRGDVSVAAVLHRSRDAAGEAFTWVAFYTFPSSIFAHSIVSVPFHAEEMD